MGRGNLICIVNVVFQGLHSPQIGAKNRTPIPMAKSDVFTQFYV